METKVDFDSDAVRVEIRDADTAAVIVGEEENERIYLPPTEELDSTYYQSDASVLRETEEGYELEHSGDATTVRIVS